MKTRRDINSSLVQIAFGVLFMSPVLTNGGFRLTAFGIGWIVLSSFLVMLGLWRIEHYELKEAHLIKYNFLGLVKRYRSLDDLQQIKKKVINPAPSSDLFNIIRLFKKEAKYNSFRILSLEFKHQRKLRLNESTQQREDFNKLYKRLKNFEEET